MTLESLTTIWNVRPKGVLHVGAHKAEESSDYERLGWGHVIWVEAQPDLAAELKNRLDPLKNLVVNAAIWGTSGITFDFKVATNSQSSSLLEFGTHKKDYPDITVADSYEVVTSTLEEVIDNTNEFDFLNLDIQGVELEALRGLGSHFEKVNWIYTEVNKSEVYANCSKVKDIDVFLKTKGFKRIATRWMMRQGWGDALYIRESVSVPLTSKLMAAANHFKWLKSQCPSPARFLQRSITRLGHRDKN